MDAAFTYVESNPLETSVEYPYTSGNKVRGTCLYNANATGKAVISGYKNVPTKNVNAMKNALA
jgi:hypothetical protein